MSAHIAVVEKAFAVLEAMSDLGRSATLKEVSEITGYPKATLYRVLQTLANLGYVDQDYARSRYLLSTRISELGRGDGYQELRNRALPIMERLHGRFNETINLGVLVGNYVEYVHFIETSRSLRLKVRPGVRDPFHCTALGRAIAAGLPEPRRRKLLAELVIDPNSPASSSTKAEVEAALEEATRRGWAYDDEETDAGVVCFGVPLPGVGTPIAGISVSVVKSRLTKDLRDEIVDALRELRQAQS